MGSHSCCVEASLESRRIYELTSVLQIVAEKNRLRLLCVLNHGSHSVNSLMPHVNMSHSLVSHHLADLKSFGMVVSNKHGRKAFYRLTKLGKRTISLLKEIPYREGVSK